MGVIVGAAGVADHRNDRGEEGQSAERRDLRYRCRGGSGLQLVEARLQAAGALGGFHFDRPVPGGGEALRARGLAQFFDSGGKFADRPGGADRRAGQGEGGDEGALALGGPAVDPFELSRDRVELERRGDFGVGVEGLWSATHRPV